jgi:Ni/Co efflux regulator RcnB
MERFALSAKYALILAIAGIWAASPAYADKPSWAGGDKGQRSGQQQKSGAENRDRRDDRQDSSDKRNRPAVKIGQHFDERYRTATREYYGEQFRSGHCPPGLAKKHNGCMPPGQARKWVVGRPLPRDVIYHAVPPALVIQFGQPPSGHRYVRVASDILLIALGTGMVIDAIQDLGGM